MSKEITDHKHPFPHYFQRTLWPLIAGFGAFLLWHSGLMPGDNAAIPAFISYVIVGLFYDWLVFSYLGYKESSRGTPEQCAISEIKADEANKLNDFYVMVRRCVSISV